MHMSTPSFLTTCCVGVHVYKYEHQYVCLLFSQNKVSSAAPICCLAFSVSDYNCVFTHNITLRGHLSVMTTHDCDCLEFNTLTLSEDCLAINTK